MTEPQLPPRYRMDAGKIRVRVLGAVLGIALMLWALLLRDDPDMTFGLRVFGWVMVAALALWLVSVLRRRG